LGLASPTLADLAAFILAFRNLSNSFFTLSAFAFLLGLGFATWVALAVLLGLRLLWLLLAGFGILLGMDLGVALSLLALLAGFPFELATLLPF